MKSLMSYFYRASAWAGVLDTDNRLEWAARRGRTQTVRVLLEAGANVHADEDEALRIAAWSGRPATVRLLLEAGADAHARQDEALRWAEKENDSTKSWKIPSAMSPADVNRLQQIQQRREETVEVLKNWMAHHPQRSPV